MLNRSRRTAQESNKWKILHNKVGPLRYQMSNGDCVPITVSNAMLVLLGHPLQAKLLSLIWANSMDGNRGEGSGWVCCQLLSDTINAWARWSYQHESDGYSVGDNFVRGKKKIRQICKLNSDIFSGDISLEQNNQIPRCLNSGGVVCIATEEAGHYELLLEKDGERFLGFDPSWKPDRDLSQFEDYCGFVNRTWTRKELVAELGTSRWVQIIQPVEGK